MYKFKNIDFNEFDDSLLDEYKKKDIYISKQWLNFLKTQNLIPIIIEINLENIKIGYFIGALFKKFGINIIGSPFGGWNTPYMGFAIKENYSRVDIIPQLWKYIKKEFKCQYMEISDKNIKEEDIKRNKIKYIVETTYVMDISKTEEELLKNFTKHCRKNLKIFVNKGATIQKVNYNEKFLNVFYDMITKVFEFQNLLPSYSKEKLKSILESISDENLLCIEAYNPDGKCIGASISLGYSEYCYALASATDRNENYKQKNYMRWYTIQYWKSKDKKTYDLMGKREYKLEFNPKDEEHYRIILTKFKILFLMRNLAKKIYWKINRFKFYIKKNKNKIKKYS